MRTARSRTSGENRFDVFFVRAPPSQAVQPPANPARFNLRPSRLATMAVDELRRQKILLPSAKALELLLQQARARAERLSHRAIIGRIRDQQRRSSTSFDAGRTRRSQRWPGCGLHHNLRLPGTFSSSSSALSTLAHSD
jgi:hypothetical protein